LIRHIPIEKTGVNHTEEQKVFLGHVEIMAHANGAKIIDYLIITKDQNKLKNGLKNIGKD